MTDDKPTCFVIMPISTPQEVVEIYQDDDLHFQHTLEHLFIPAIEKAGFNPISPQSTGSNLIQADIISNLSICDLVLCDISNLNPNVFFEFGIRTALDKPVALVVDDVTSELPFDTSIINFYKYNHCLDPWILRAEIPNLTSHIVDAHQKSSQRNSLWKYFGIKQAGVYSPEDVELGEKLDLIISEISSLKEIPQRPTKLVTKAPLTSEEKLKMARREFKRLEAQKFALEAELVHFTSSDTPDKRKIAAIKSDLEIINELQASLNQEINKLEFDL